MIQLELHHLQSQNDIAYSDTAYNGFWNQIPMIISGFGPLTWEKLYAYKIFICRISGSSYRYG